MSKSAGSVSVLGGALRRVSEGAEFRRLAAEVSAGARVVSVAGLTSAPARALALAALQRETARRFAVLVAANHDMEAWGRDLSFWCAALGVGADADCEPVLTLPASEGDPYAGASPHAETLERRALSLWNLARGRGRFVLLSSRALARRTVQPARLLEAGAVLKRDEDHPPEDLVEALLASGYVREDPVGAVGEFSMRGGILDVWSPGEGAPVRVEFFGDTVDSIRRFDPETQLSIEPLRETEVVPMRELVVGSGDFRLWAEAARERWGADETRARALKDRTALAAEGETFPGWEWLIPLLLSADASAFDYLGDSVLVVDEPGGVEQYLAGTYETLAARHAEMDAGGEIGLRPEELYLTPEELRGRVDAGPRVEFRALGRAAALVDERFAGEADEPAAKIGRARPAPRPLFLFPAVVEAPEVEWRSQPARRYHGRVPELAADVRRAREERKILTLLAMPSAGVAERVGEMFAEYHVTARVALAGEGGAGVDEFPAVVTVGRLSGGFELPAARLVVHVETDLFDEASASSDVRR